MTQDALNEDLASAFERGLKPTREADAQIGYIAFREINELAHIENTNALSAAELCARYRKIIAAYQANHDPQVARRIFMTLALIRASCAVQALRLLNTSTCCPPELTGQLKWKFACKTSTQHCRLPRR